MYGFQEDRVSHREGVCSRLDEMQAAVLRVKLRYLSSAIASRQSIARRYRDGLSETSYELPRAAEENGDAVHLYVIRIADREGVTRALDAAEIGYGIHYPVPIHRMPAYQPMSLPDVDLPVTERAAGEIVSLPMYPELQEAEVAHVIETLRVAASSS